MIYRVACVAFVSLGVVLHFLIPNTSKPNYVAGTEPPRLSHQDANPALPDTRHEAIAIVRAMSVHDASIHSIEWKSENAYRAEATGDWVLYHRAEHGMDDRGRWYSFANYGAEQPDKPMWFFMVRAWTADGNVQYMHNENSERGVVQPPDRAALWLPSPVMFLGRVTAFQGRRSIAELLLEAPDLRVSRQEDENGIVQVHATVETGGMIGELILDIDTTRDFMIVRYVLKDGLFLFPVEAWVVTKTELINGIHVPVEGYRDTTVFVPTQEDEKKLEAAMDEAGIDRTTRADPRNPETRRKLHKLVRIAFGDAGTPFAPVWHRQYLRSTEIVSLNTPIPADKFEHRFPRDLPWVNLFTQSREDGTPLDVELPDYKGAMP